MIIWIKNKAISVWNWLKSKWKAITGIAVIGTALAAGEILTPSFTSTDLMGEIAIQQNDYKTQGLNNGKYVHQPKRWDDRLKAFIQVNEYLKPDGQIGYWIIIEGDTYQKSIGYGPDASMHTWEKTWTLSDNATTAK